MPFIGCRLAYGILSFCLTKSSFASSLGWKIFLDVIPEVIVVTILVIVGILTRNMWRERQPEDKIEQQQPPYAPGQQRYTNQGQSYY